MMRKDSLRQVSIACLLVGALSPGAWAVVVLPGEGVTFEQVDFSFAAIAPIDQENSDWGRVRVDPALLASSTAISVGYLNVWTDATWVVQNLRVDSTDGLPTASTYFDLAVVVGTDVALLSAFVDYAPTPLTTFADGPRSSFGVGIWDYNAEGAGGGLVTTLWSPPPANAIVFDPGGETVAVKKDTGPPNIQTANNQCFPMSIANSLQYLEDRYGVPIPHVHKIGENGDDSLVGQLDKLAGRAVTDRKSGGTTPMVPMLKGKFKYLADHKLADKIVNKHQDGDLGSQPLPAGDFTAHGITSKDESVGGKVTWQWICDEVARGEDVEVVINYTGGGGHAVRVFECGKTGGKPWLRIVHDAQQTHATKDPTDTKGLETPEWKMAGVTSDQVVGKGTLNFAMSESAKGDPHVTVPGDQPSGTQMTIGGPDVATIPADFFGPGSDPFTGTVLLQGDLIDLDVWRDASTVVLRSGTPVLPSDPILTVGSVDVEITELNLVSMFPITVTFNGGQNPEAWDVRVTLATLYPQIGQLTATKTHANGGTFNINLPVQPVLTFTRVSDSAQAVLNTGQEGQPPVALAANGVPWVHLLDASIEVLAPWDGEFVPSVEELIPGIPATQQTVVMTAETPSQSVRHSVVPTLVDLCPLVFETPLDPCFALRQQCVGTDTQTCWPARWTPEEGVTQCECVTDPFGDCGAVDVGTDGTLSCPGTVCTSGPGCEISIDGQSTGQSSILQVQVPNGSAVTCGCAVGSTDVPASSGVGLVAIGLALLGGGAVVFGRRRQMAA